MYIHLKPILNNVLLKNMMLPVLLCIRHCGIQSPSWSELAHFIRFLDKQLRDFERSCFCQDYFKAELPGFAQFVLKFLIQMSRVQYIEQFFASYYSNIFYFVVYLYCLHFDLIKQEETNSIVQVCFNSFPLLFRFSLNI